MRVFVKHLSNLMSIIAGLVLLIMAGLTLADVVLRYFGKPIPGAYELVAFMGVAVAALALPRASMLNTHVYVDLAVDRMPDRWQRFFRIFTRLLVFLMFLVGAWYFVYMARNFIVTETVTMTLRVPFYPVVFALSAASIAQCLVCLCEIFGGQGGGNG